MVIEVGFVLFMDLNFVSTVFYHFSIFICWFCLLNLCMSWYSWL